MFLAIQRKRATAENPTGNLDVKNSWVETNAENVVRNLQKKSDVEYYAITLSASGARIQKATIKAGARNLAPQREIIEVEAGGNVVGKLEVEV